MPGKILYPHALRFISALVMLPLCLISESKSKSESFEITLQLSFSKMAEAKLKALSEDVVVSASYSGAPKSSAQKYADEIGQIDLGRDEVRTVVGTGAVHIPGIGIHRDRIAWIDGPLLLNINVYSGRKADPDNFLNCDFFDGELHTAVKTPVMIHCFLISEKSQNKHLS